MATYAGKLKVAGTELPIASTLYGTCSTAAETVAKVVTCANFDSLIAGVTIHVKFTHRNSASSPTLNVNGTGAKAIKITGTNGVSGLVDYSWNDGSLMSFTYDGTYWYTDNCRSEDLFYVGEQLNFVGYVYGRVTNNGTSVVVAAPLRKGISLDATSCTVAINSWIGYSTSGTRNLNSNPTVSNISIKPSAGQVVFQAGDLASSATAGTPYVAEVNLTIKFT